MSDRIQAWLGGQVEEMRWGLDGYWFSPEWDAEDTRLFLTLWIEEGRRVAFWKGVAL